jgi:hypothetical protein
LFQIVSVDAVEGGEAVAVDVEDGNYLSLPKDGNNDFASRS